MPNEVDRVTTDELNAKQEDALVTLMHQDYKTRKFDVERVRRTAIGIQIDPMICQATGAAVRTAETAWVPPDAWIADMRKAFAKIAEEEKAAQKKKRESAFGGGRDVGGYDPKNPFGRKEPHRPRPTSASTKATGSHRVSRSPARMPASPAASNPFESRIFSQPAVRNAAS